MNVLKRLLPQTESVFKEIAGKSFLDRFTFVGGSALSIYLNHRKSEDLDFFSWEKQIDVDRILSGLDSGELVVLNRSEIQLDLLYKSVKITFFANGWEELSKRNKLFENVYISPVEILAAMKVNTLFIRAKFRDYYDLYVICREKFTVSELFKISKPLIPNLNPTWKEKHTFKKYFIFNVLNM